MTRRRRKAVAMAHVLEPDIWRRLTSETKCSTEVSTFSVDTMRRKEERPGVASAEGAMVSPLSLTMCAQLDVAEIFEYLRVVGCNRRYGVVVVVAVYGC
jgi:hypothetical protein